MTNTTHEFHDAVYSAVKKTIEEVGLDAVKKMSMFKEGRDLMTDTTHDGLVKVTVSDGKYTFGQREDGSCYALRYGEPWREDVFDGLTLAMAHRIEELEAKLAKAGRFIELAVELGRWDLNPSFRDEMIVFTIELKGQDDE